MKAILCKKTSPGRIRASDNDGSFALYQIESDDSMEGAYDAACKKLCAKMDWHGMLLRGWLGDGLRCYCWIPNEIAAVITLCPKFQTEEMIAV